MKAIVKIPEKKRMYRIVEIGDKKYLIDPEEYKISYIFPMINWFIPKKAKELTDEELEALNPQKPMSKEEKKERNKLIWGAAGTSTLFVSTSKGYIDYFDVQSSNILNTLVFLVIVILAISIRMYLSIRMRDKKINFKLYDSKIVYVPSIKIALAALFAYVVTSLTIFGMTNYLIYYGIDNLIIPILYLVVIFGFLLCNLFFISPGKAYVKIKKRK